MSSRQNLMRRIRLILNSRSYRVHEAQTRQKKVVLVDHTNWSALLFDLNSTGVVQPVADGSSERSDSAMTIPSRMAVEAVGADIVNCFV